MSTRVVDRIDGWDEQSVSGGYRGLHDLADRGFSGVVRAGAATLYMTNGTVVGIEDGTVEEFEDGGTAYRAPSAALPLLAVMQERSDEVRAKYYTEDTAISAVDRTLTDGGFTGFVELSENVLSGDYYLVYHGGESMSVAFVGNSAKLIDGDEAFETADDEVGIYEVRPVEIDAVELPEPEPDPEPNSGGAETGTGAVAAAEEAAEGPDDPGATGGATTEAASAGPGAEDGGVAGAEPEPDPEPGSGADVEPDPAGSPAEADAGAVPEPEPAEPESDPATDGTTARAAGTGVDTGDATGTGNAGSPTPGDRSSGPGADTSAGPDPGSTAGGASRPGPEPGVGGGGPRGTAEERPAEGPGSASTAESGAEAVDAALETRSIPSLDPNRTADTADVQANPGPGAGARDAEPAAPEPRQEPDGAAGTDRAGTAEPATGEAAGSANAGGGAQARADETAELREELERREAEIDRLEEELAAADREREGLEADLAELREERDDLRAEVERLEEELERLREEFGAAGEADRRLTPAEALDGTDLFVRYRSKGDATLEKAHDGEGRKSEVTDNLRLEKHTQFDAESAAVGGQAYDAFLEERIEYGFVRWVVEDLLFEIRDTGHAEALADLYDALPKVDRAELDGAIAVTYTEDGQEQRGQESFDIVLRDRMGNPLLVANLNDSREAATEGMMEGLITAAERVGQSKDTFVGAFLVTRSFFEPEALETASEATKSGLLSRDKRQSFVNLSRKRGYHLCLVEARNQNFHLAVPEL